MKVKYLFVLFICFLLTGCIFNPYHDSKFGEIVIDTWFNEDDLGDVRKKIENINEIIDRSCVYLEDNGSNYVYECELVYRPIGETVIPLSKNKTILLFAIYSPFDNTFSYRVYNSNSEYGIWKLDNDLKY